MITVDTSNQEMSISNLDQMVLGCFGWRSSESFDKICPLWEISLFVTQEILIYGETSCDFSSLLCFVVDYGIIQFLTYIKCILKNNHSNGVTRCQYSMFCSSPALQCCKLVLQWPHQFRNWTQCLVHKSVIVIVYTWKCVVYAWMLL